MRSIEKTVVRTLLPAALALFATTAGAAGTAPVVTTAEVLARSAPQDWRTPAADDLLVMQLAGGRVVIELATAFAPQHADNIRTLVRERYFDGLAIVRVQDNYVVQWGDPSGNKTLGKARATLQGEFFRRSAGLRFTTLADGDVYAPEVGYVDGFPAARDPRRGEAWLAHCYGMLGVGRDIGADSGGGNELYVVIGHAPRHLDRNITLAGRVLQGMDVLSVLPRGSGAMGFHEAPEALAPITSIRLAGELPAAERPRLQVLRTDTPTWSAYVDTRRYRRDAWFIEPTGRVDLCNVGVPVRATP